MHEREAEFFLKEGLVCNGVIAEGGFGIVFNVYSLQYQTYFALKKIPEQRFNEAEIECMKRLDHPNACNLYNYYRFNGFVYMLLEYCPSDLYNLMKLHESLEDDLLKKYCYEILVSIKACHDQNIAHSDIKPSNFLLDKYGRLKICDFGLAAMYEDENMRSKTFKGTMLFMAPEVLNKREYNPIKADIWSIGVAFYFLASNSYPFDAKDKQTLLYLLNSGIYHTHSIDNSHLRQVIEKCLKMNPNERATIDELLKMPYFDSMNKKSLAFTSRARATQSTRALIVLPNSVINRQKRIQRNTSLPCTSRRLVL
ncbi:CAMK family protein kinase [Trichomonas vaginalis G3]|uniref:CAMK family protein kinase n=1 Tax=Trichomonas vaginalis (strain ATCC PRA-98 / G3) TaxID=412133 RepID=A2F5L3_TRIV3|nr:protein serine/threonine kinase protein [Trichomonas vaginalis G3]EAX99776.1 CAMK family protein kinase [Trichomonas vaginalis G3]KAI5494410.1 protein serine/threonine kinase protein [Trichomonas vaginalis G3]|eukprot:XP_001312706.1 CAMK family protein kinase [Trichomonas vaginalis G3]